MFETHRSTRSRRAVVDPFAVECLDRWWRMLTDDEMTVVTHGAREEVRFALHFAGAPPRRLVDVQVAEGFLSRGFPLSYKALVRRVLNEQIDTHETRTDWAKRPLESRQIDFKKLIKGGLNEDIRLRPGDMIFIPRSKMGNVRRFMEVARVGLFFTPFGLL